MQIKFKLKDSGKRLNRRCRKRVQLSSLEQLTSNRMTRARIPTQSKASLFPEKDYKFFKFELLNLLNLAKCISQN